MEHQLLRLVYLVRKLTRLLSVVIADILGRIILLFQKQVPDFAYCIICIFLLFFFTYLGQT